jgi:hypothetical protein
MFGGCKASLGELYFAFTSFPEGYEGHTNSQRANIVCGHLLSRLALGVTQQGQTRQVSYYMKEQLNGQSRL